MGKFAEKHARNMTVMLTAGGDINDILEMGKAFGVRAIHLNQLDVPPEEESARLNLLSALKYK